MTRHDVIVVGAGPAGSTHAATLASLGRRVLLLEKARFPRDKTCGDFVSPIGLKLLQELGCGEAVEAGGYVPIRGSRVYFNGESVHDGELPAVEGLPDHGHAIPRYELDELLFRRAQAAGAVTIEGCSVQGVEIDAEGVRVSALVGGQEERFEGEVVVGADGANSVVARAVGMDVSDPRYVHFSMRAYCRGLDLDRTVLYFDETFFPGFGWIFPTRPGQANVGVGIGAEAAKKRGIKLREFYERVLEFARGLAEEAGVCLEIDRPTGFPIKSYGGARSNHFERGLLIGDAGCFVDPISGEGIPIAMESARLAAEVVEEALAAGDYRPERFARFEERWRGRYDRDLLLTDLAVSLIRNPHLDELWLRGLRAVCEAASRDPECGRTLGGMMAGIVPNRESLSPEFALRFLAQRPDFWLKVLDLRPDQPLSHQLDRLAGLAAWQLDTCTRLLEDREWVGSWLTELQQKQHRLLRALLGESGTGRNS